MQLSLFGSGEDGDDEHLGRDGQGPLAEAPAGELRGARDPDGFFERLGEEAAARYLVIRDGLLEGVNPNDGTVGWAEFQERVAQADQAAQEIVDREMVYLPPGEADRTGE